MVQPGSSGPVGCAPWGSSFSREFPAEAGRTIALSGVQRSGLGVFFPRRKRAFFSGGVDVLGAPPADEPELPELWSACCGAGGGGGGDEAQRTTLL